MLSRLQFAATASFHIIFPCLIIGLALYLTMMETLWLKTRQAMYRIQYEFWVKPFAAAFIVAVMTGVVLSYQLDTTFSGFYYKTLNVLVSIREIEVANALFLEAGFFGIMVWGWRQVGHRLHFLATIMVTLGTIASAICILARNSWMQTPDGVLLLDGQLMVDDWLSAIFSPSFPYRFFHMLGATYLSTACCVLGISAWFLLKRRHQEFAQFSLRVSLLAILILTPLQFLSGDLHGLNTKEHQPTKLAAIEALWDTTEGAPLVLFALPDQELESNRYSLGIPKLASLIVTHDLNGKITGLKDVPKEQRPNVPIVFFSFRIMVAMGMMMVAVGVCGLVLLGKGRLYSSRRFLRVCCWMVPSGFIATIAGWCVSEAGRQPWVVYGLVKTAEVMAPIPTAQALRSLSYIGIAYGVLVTIFVCYLCHIIKRGPDDGGHVCTQEDLTEQNGH